MSCARVYVCIVSMGHWRQFFCFGDRYVLFCSLQAGAGWRGRGRARSGRAALRAGAPDPLATARRWCLKKTTTTLTAVSEQDSFRTLRAAIALLHLPYPGPTVAATKTSSHQQAKFCGVSWALWKNVFGVL